MFSPLWRLVKSLHLHPTIFFQEGKVKTTLSGLKSEKFKAYFALACVCFFWGTTYLALRIGITSVPPFFFSGVRQAVAGCLIILYFMIKGYPLPDPRELVNHVIAGILMITFGNGLVAWAELYVPSGLAALICSLVPIWIILINLMFRAEEKPNKLVIIGTIVGFAGILIIFGDNIKDFANSNYAYGIMGIMIANLSWAIGTVRNKKSKRKTDPIFAAGLQVFSGGILMLVISIFTEDTSQVNFTSESIIALLYLISFGTIIAFGAYIYALSKLPTSQVSIYAYINPLVAILLGWAILDEKMSWGVVLAFVVTVTGIWLVNKGLAKK